MMAQLKSDEMARQCYVTGGPSVFTARAMYWMMTNDVKWMFQDDCVNQTGYFKTNTETNSIPLKTPELSFRIYPNPSQGKNKLTVVSSESGQLAMYNSWGEKVVQKSYCTGESLLEVGTLPSGLYCYFSQGINGDTFTGLLVIKER